MWSLPEESAIDVIICMSQGNRSLSHVSGCEKPVKSTPALFRRIKMFFVTKLTGDLSFQFRNFL